MALDVEEINRLLVVRERDACTEFTYPEEEVEDKEQILQVDDQPVILFALEMGHDHQACKEHMVTRPAKNTRKLRRYFSLSGQRHVSCVAC